MDGDKFVYATFYTRIYARIAIIINCTFTIAAFVLLFAGDVIVYWDSFSKRFQEEVLRKFNYSQPLMMSDVRAFFDFPGYDIFRNESTHLNIAYGTTWINWCWNDPPLLGGFPSILRLLEFHSVSQLLLRFTFLTSLSLRPIATYGRSLAVSCRFSCAEGKGSPSSPSSHETRPLGIFTSILLFAAPPLQFLSTLSGCLILAWQQDLDFHSLMYAPYYAFAVCYLLHMLVYTSIELLEPERMIPSRAGTRASIIITYCWTVWRTMERQIEFLNRKTCHINVAPLDALCEYLLLFMITLFSLLEWTDVWNLNVTVVENPEEMAMIRRTRVRRR
ncbi:hypothetical protein PRIPAC_81822 [Pristionchus pacificus]|uniref:Uncharacterized protein n=1 Tax=Pristionchus pacificus TaxID=54126 RepID=A0A2A6CQ87_PRIPA|nr:hypothetical protein PRIPAC_81822 [Pristionchus pacificus]|eukprot:PDM80256.1 hypothetical protein PRIPAC_32835 [Pristionchus pacificus]